MGAFDLFTVDETLDGFFAPAATDLVDTLVAEFKQARERIGQVAEFAQSECCRSVIGYFLSGNATEERGRVSMQMSAQQLFQEDGAVAALNAAYWQKALDLTDVYEAMPQERRNQWNAQIRHPAGCRKSGSRSDEWEIPPLPAFEEDTVRATLQGLLVSRAKFLAERVDSIFRALSGQHVTNSPAAFGKRLIIAGLVNSYGNTDHDRAGYISDLRAVIAKFMGRDAPRWNSTAYVLERARRECRGEWVSLDGGALKLRAYLCGTAHLEVHPDMAWRLNCVLAQLYPQAIPPQFRAAPKKKPKQHAMMGRPLPFRVIDALTELETAYKLVANTGPDKWRHQYRRQEIRNGLQWRNGGIADKVLLDEIEHVLGYIGGLRLANDRGGHYFQFDYDPREAIAEIVCTGCLPDRKAHQYYPTPPRVAEFLMQKAAEGTNDATTWLEPSAGTGALADRMPKENTVCVEIAPVHCRVLTGKGHHVEEADFLRWTPGRRFDRIVANPPFSDGRWQAHLEHASTLLAAGGRLHFVLPASARGSDVLPGWSCEWSPVFENEFAGTSIAVVVLSAALPVASTA